MSHLAELASILKLLNKELKEDNALYCPDCSEPYLACLCPKGEQPEVCPEPWMKRV